MGICIVAYRVRIGLFHGGGLVKERTTFSIRSRYRYNDADNIQYRCFATMVVILVVLVACNVTQRLACHLGTTLDTRCDVREPTLECNHINLNTSNLVYLNVHGYDMYGTLSCSYKFYSQRLLILSSDVELNPGPSPETCQIIQAIESANLAMSQKIERVIGDVAVVRSEIYQVMKDVTDIKSKVNDIELKQVKFESNLKAFENRFDKLEHATEIIDSDMAALSLSYEKKCDELDNLKKHLSNIEREMHQNDIRIFGLDEDASESETPETLKAKVKDEILRVAYPSENYECEPILSARRVGFRRVGQPRLVIVRLSSLKHKFAIFGVRDVLRHNNIKVASVLTSFEREQLKELNARGRKGYFKNGELVVLQEEDESKDRRRIQRASRRLPPDSTQLNVSNGSTYADALATTSSDPSSVE